MIQIKKDADMVNVFGSTIAKMIKTTMTPNNAKKKPVLVSLVETKPAFYLNDGATLQVFAVIISTGEVLGSRYCGSADTAHIHLEQFTEGVTAPDNCALFFVEREGNGLWTLTVVSSNIIKNIAA